MEINEWEILLESDFESTHRLKIDRGYLYRFSERNANTGETSVLSMCFVSNGNEHGFPHCQKCCDEVH